MPIVTGNTISALKYYLILSISFNLGFVWVFKFGYVFVASLTFEISQNYTAIFLKIKKGENKLL